MQDKMTCSYCKRRIQKPAEALTEWENGDAIRKIICKRCFRDKYHIRPRRKEPYQGVYVLYCDGWYKIGHSRNIKRRYRTISGATPHRVDFVACIETDFPEELELVYHEIYDEFRLGSKEWFDLPKHAVEHLISKSVKPPKRVIEGW